MDSMPWVFGSLGIKESRGPSSSPLRGNDLGKVFAIFQSKLIRVLKGRTSFSWPKTHSGNNKQLEAMDKLVNGLLLVGSTYFNMLRVEVRVRSSDHGEELTPLAAAAAAAAAARGKELLKAFDLMVLHGLAETKEIPI